MGLASLTIHYPLSTLYFPGPMKSRLNSKIDISKAGIRV